MIVPSNSQIANHLDGQIVHGRTDSQEDSPLGTWKRPWHPAFIIVVSVLGWPFLAPLLNRQWIKAAGLLCLHIALAEFHNSTGGVGFGPHLAVQALAILDGAYIAHRRYRGDEIGPFAWFWH